MIDILNRVRNKELQAKIVTAEEAAAFIKPGMNVGTSGFTPSGYPKAVPMALAARMEKEHFQINLWTGASTGDEEDGALARANGIKFRMPYQTNKDMRNAINSGKIDYCDLHLSESAQLARYGFLGGKIDVAIVEACAITEEGNIIPTTSMGNSASYVETADVVIVEVNTTQPMELEGMHDVYVPLDPPNRLPIPIVKPNDRIGTPYIQSGVGAVANAVISGFVDSDLKDLTVFTEVIQDGMFDLIDAGKLSFASGTALSPSPEGLERFYKNIKEYRKHIVLRPQEVANSPEIARRIGIIAMNTAIECDIYGNVNSTHIMGSKMMNGIGGSGDFARNAYLTVFFTVSTAKGGAISSIVPMCSHVDHTEHDVDIIVTEQGLADLRGLSPRQRAKVIIENCAHPDYKPMLMDYYERALKETKQAHTPHILTEALSWHERFQETGTMKK